MNDSYGGPRSHHSDLWSTEIVAPPFVAADIYQRAILPSTKERLATIIETEIVPRLVAMHGETVPASTADDQPTREDIAKLASLVLDPDTQLSADFIGELKERGLSMDGLFVNLLEPAARCLGTMWEDDACDFVDVTLGVGRLQQLLSLFSLSYAIPAFVEKRRVCMVGIVEEQHSFGMSMVEKFLRAGGWDVRSERGMKVQQIAPLMRSEWFAVVGLTASTDRHLDKLAATIREIRLHSRNPAVGIMVGGPPFSGNPALATTVGADATALNAPAAVLLAQKLFDEGAKVGWRRAAR